MTEKQLLPQLTLLVLLLLTPTNTTFTRTKRKSRFRRNNTKTGPTKVTISTRITSHVNLVIRPMGQRILTFKIGTAKRVRTSPKQRMSIAGPINNAIAGLLIRPKRRIRTNRTLTIVADKRLTRLQIATLRGSTRHRKGIRRTRTSLRLTQRACRRRRRVTLETVRTTQASIQMTRRRCSHSSRLTTRKTVTHHRLLTSRTNLTSTGRTLTRTRDRLRILDTHAKITRTRATLGITHSHSRLDSRACRAQLRRLKTATGTSNAVAVGTPVTNAVTSHSIALKRSTRSTNTILVAVISGHAMLTTTGVFRGSLSRMSPKRQIQVAITDLPSRVFRKRVAAINSMISNRAQIIPIRTRLSGTRNALGPNVFTSLRILARDATRTIVTVPRSTIMRTGNRPLIFIHGNGTFRPISVALKEATNSQMRILDNLFRNSRVIARQTGRLCTRSLQNNDTRPTRRATTPTRTITTTNVP